MKKYTIKMYTYGMELEYADVKYGQKLPEGSEWNTKDYTIVNSNGIANDPKGKLYGYGGEINTKPTGTIEEQIKVVKSIRKCLNPKPIVNYRCNLHIHIGVPGLEKDLSNCKRLFKYINKYADEAYEIVDNIQKPERDWFITDEEYKGAIKRHHHSLKSHHRKLSPNRIAAILKAKTTKEFYEEHAPLTDKGRMWYFAPRAGINIRHLWTTGTIEFRHFYGTLNYNELKYSLLWCQQFVYAALNTGNPPKEIYKSIYKKYGHPKFPKCPIYDHTLELNFRKTSIGKIKRKEAEKNIAIILGR